MSDPAWVGRLLLAVVASIGPGIRAQAPKVGQLAPAFTLRTIDGDSVRFSQFRGQPVVLKFWATWCPTCRTEMPELIAAREAHAKGAITPVEFADGIRAIIPSQYQE